MAELPKCTLCDNTCDPRMWLLDRDSNVWPMCDGHAPDNDEASGPVADQCRASGAQPYTGGLPRFGFNEPRVDGGGQT